MRQLFDALAPPWCNFSVSSSEDVYEEEKKTVDVDISSAGE